MSAFTESALIKKLGELNSSQQAIQTLSLWLIHHRKHHVTIIKTWLREIQTVPEGKKLTFMYLANDVIQNSKKKGPEYGKEFASVLPKVFSHIGELCTSDKLFGSLGRILNIWEERSVYDPKIIKEFRSRLNKNRKDPPPPSSGSAAVTTTSTTASSQAGNATANAAGDTANGPKASHEKREKRKHDDSKSTKSKKHRHGDEKSAATSAGNHTSNEHGGGAAKAATAAKIATAAKSATVAKAQSVAAAGANQASPYVPIGEPPEPDELIRALTSMESTASSDAVVRECIANLPPEISEISCLAKLQDKDAAKSLSKQVNEAVDLLHNYNARLATEMEERTKLATMLREYQAEQVELLAQADQRLEEYKVKLNNLLAVQKEINSHLSNLPDLTQLPDVTGGLAPLPSAGDLFNVHT